MSRNLLNAAMRVAARAAAIQLEEIAARSAVAGPSGTDKGKGRAAPVHRDPIGHEEGKLQSPATVGSVMREGTARFDDAHTVSESIGNGNTSSSTSRIIDGQEKVTKHARNTLPVTPGYLPTPPLSGSIPKLDTRPGIPIEHESTTANSPQSSTPSQVLVSSADIEQPPKLGPEPLASISAPSIVHTLEPVTQTATDSSANAIKPVTSYVPVANLDNLATDAEQEDSPVLLRASKVPSSRLGRLFHYGSLAASLSLGAASESIRRSTGSGGQGSVFMSDANVRRLVATLGRMRGAALKLGQFMSIQDNNMLPSEIEKVLQQVQANANYMPDWQMEKVMSSELGSDWKSLFTTFDRTPIASASIGQVHKAILASSGQEVAIKIQFPGISSSISSDLANLSLLLRSSALLPKGLYLNNTIAVMRRELEDECDYIREAESGKRFEKLLKGDREFIVPKVIEEASTSKVLTTEWMDGRPLSKMKGMSQDTRNKIGTSILRLCLQELFKFRFMQTDPNWANFLYTSSSSTSPKIQLIDFGASREYTKSFMDKWYLLLKSALTSDRSAMILHSLELGYLTGEEEEIMLDAHIKSMELVASPFKFSGGYDFSGQTITEEVRRLIPVMLKYRLTPPPNETYSLNRKLSGCFLMCAKLGAVVDCQALWDEVVGDYQIGEEAEKEQE